MAKLRGRKPLGFLTALETAEASYAASVSSGPRFVSLPLDDIELWPELFQPREASFGTTPVDDGHVSKLKREIEIKDGPLDPILVIRLGDKWFCVDGHHRLEAYKAISWSKPLRCERFQGPSVKAAIDDALRRNSHQHLSLSSADRQEAAWRHVVSAWGSIGEISSSCGVSRRQVSVMREVKASWDEKGSIGTRMRRKARGGPKSVTWQHARYLYKGLDEEEIDEEEQAQRLARALNDRMTDRLRRNPRVATRALEIHCRALVDYIRIHAEEDLADAEKSPEDRFAL